MNCENKLQVSKTKMQSIRALMAIRNISQREVSNSLQISSAALSKKLKGDIRFSAEEISVLADIFNVSADVLLGRAPLVVS